MAWTRTRDNTDTLSGPSCKHLNSRSDNSNNVFRERRNTEEFVFETANDKARFDIAFIQDNFSSDRGSTQWSREQPSSTIIRMDLAFVDVGEDKVNRYRTAEPGNSELSAEVTEATRPEESAASLRQIILSNRNLTPPRLSLSTEFIRLTDCGVVGSSNTINAAESPLITTASSTAESSDSGLHLYKNSEKPNQLAKMPSFARMQDSQPEPAIDLAETHQEVSCYVGKRGLKRKVPRTELLSQTKNVDWDEGLRPETNMKPPKRTKSSSNTNKKKPSANKADKFENKRGAKIRGHSGENLSKKTLLSRIPSPPQRTAASTRARRAPKLKPASYITDSESEEGNEDEKTSPLGVPGTKTNNADKTEVQVQDSQPNDEALVANKPQLGDFDHLTTTHHLGNGKITKHSPAFETNINEGSPPATPLIEALPSPSLAQSVQVSIGTKTNTSREWRMEISRYNMRSTESDRLVEECCLERNPGEGETSVTFGTKLGNMINESLIHPWTPVPIKASIMHPAIAEGEASRNDESPSLKNLDLKSCLKASHTGSAQQSYRGTAQLNQSQLDLEGQVRTLDTDVERRDAVSQAESPLNEQQPKRTESTKFSPQSTREVTVTIPGDVSINFPRVHDLATIHGDIQATNSLDSKAQSIDTEEEESRQISASKQVFITREEKFVSFYRKGHTHGSSFKHAEACHIAEASNQDPPAQPVIVDRGPLRHSPKPLIGTLLEETDPPPTRSPPTDLYSGTNPMPEPGQKSISMEPSHQNCSSNRVSRSPTGLIAPRKAQIANWNATGARNQNSISRRSTSKFGLRSNCMPSVAKEHNPAKKGRTLIGIGNKTPPVSASVGNTHSALMRPVETLESDRIEAKIGPQSDADITLLSHNSRKKALPGSRVDENGSPRLSRGRSSLTMSPQLDLEDMQTVQDGDDSEYIDLVSGDDSMTSDEQVSRNTITRSRELRPGLSPPYLSPDQIRPPNSALVRVRNSAESSSNSIGITRVLSKTYPHAPTRITTQPLRSRPWALGAMAQKLMPPPLSRAPHSRPASGDHVYQSDYPPATTMGGKRPDLDQNEAKIALPPGPKRKFERKKNKVAVPAIAVPTLSPTLSLRSRLLSQAEGLTRKRVSDVEHGNDKVSSRAEGYLEMHTALVHDPDSNKHQVRRVHCFAGQPTSQSVSHQEFYKALDRPEKYKCKTFADDPKSCDKQVYASQSKLRDVITEMTDNLLLRLKEEEDAIRGNVGQYEQAGKLMLDEVNKYWKKRIGARSENTIDQFNTARLKVESCLLMVQQSKATAEHRRNQNCNNGSSGSHLTTVIEELNRCIEQEDVSTEDPSKGGG